MKSFTKHLTLALVALGLAGCATARTPVNGLLYTDVKAPILATSQPMQYGDRKAEACATSILGLFATGDASIEAAKMNGRIATITSVDYKTNQVLGFYAKTCTIISGR